ncbi:divalent-cation tolerance protein CutA [Candidatus Roizmanbacteria bacterium]|nr:divalent-cation tolerance protein CutA [Candidatus Roizmanbacteria bacterium]
MTLLYLTCANNKEADKIAKALLDKKFVVCAKKLPVSSSFFWKGTIDKADETLLILETEEELFDEIETEVRKLHSYETFVLFSIPINKASKGVKEWMREGLKLT